ncbi:MAG: hypothetical protein II973_13855 [Spirochaetaceae bacterium]|nr:hypothetical protein [Spirochaetaceae bacterium]MDD6487132.1 hypothetical protein [Spirochaetales bacterium]
MNSVLGCKKNQIKVIFIDRNCGFCSVWQNMRTGALFLFQGCVKFGDVPILKMSFFKFGLCSVFIVTSFA